MYPYTDIARAELSDDDGTFRLRVVGYDTDDPDEVHEDHLVVGVEVETPSVAWQSRAMAVKGPALNGLVDAAQRLTAGAGRSAWRFNGEDGDLAFRFRFHPETGCVHISIVVGDRLELDVPAFPPDEPRTFLLRVRPDELQAFAEALDVIAQRSRKRLQWTG